MNQLLEPRGAAQKRPPMGQALERGWSCPPVNYMRKRDGFWGLYRGSTSRVVCHLVSSLTFHQVTSRITFKVRSAGLLRAD